MVITIYDTLLWGCTVFHGHKVGMVLLYFQVCLLRKPKLEHCWRIYYSSCQNKHLWYCSSSPISRDELLFLLFVFLITNNTVIPSFLLWCRQRPCFLLPGLCFIHHCPVIIRTIFASFYRPSFYGRILVACSIKQYGISCHVQQWSSKGTAFPRPHICPQLQYHT